MGKTEGGAKGRRKEGHWRKSCSLPKVPVPSGWWLAALLGALRP